MVEETIMVHIDLENVRKGAAHLAEFRRRICYRTLVDELARGRAIARVCVYDSLGPDAEDVGGRRRRLHAHLRHLGFTVIVRRTRRSDAQKGVDVEMGLEAMDVARESSATTAVLATGDEDFVPLVERLQRRGLRVEVASWKRALDPVLAAAADEAVVVDRLRINEPIPDGGGDNRRLRPTATAAVDLEILQVPA